MPPPMPNPAKRMTAQPSRPVQRYRPGKAVAEEESSDEEESEEDQRQQQQQQQQQQQNTRRARPAPRQQAPAKGDDDDDDDDEEGFVTDPEDGEDEAPPQKPAVATSRPAVDARVQSRPIEQSDDEDEDDDEDEESSDEDDDDESDDSSSSSAPEPARKFQRPTFIRKSDRNNNTTSASAALLSDVAASDRDQIQSKDRKIAEADVILREKLERDAAARAAGRRAWDDDNDDDVAPEDMVDDTDGLDPAAEHAAWRLRELKRLQRDREALVAREREIEELERRRNLTAEEREAEDRDFLAGQKEAREQTRGQARVLAKYHHKGAFFRGDEDAEALAQRDLMGAAFEDDVADKAALPEYMRVRDMSKLGKKGRTRYKDLKSEDTGRFGDDDRSRRWDGSRKEGGGGGGGGVNRATAGIDERFLPDRDEYGDGRNGPRISGANASALGNRRRTTTATRENRSNSPHSPSRRKRSPDRHSPDWDRDKRRRVDAVS